MIEIGLHHGTPLGLAIASTPSPRRAHCQAQQADGAGMAITATYEVGRQHQLRLSDHGDLSTVTVLELRCERFAPDRSPSLKLDFSLLPRLREIRIHDMTVDQLLSGLPVNLEALQVVSPTIDGGRLHAPSFKALATKLEDVGWLPHLRKLYIYMLHFNLWDHADGRTPTANTIWIDFMRIDQAAKVRGNLTFLLC